MVRAQGRGARTSTPFRLVTGTGVGGLQRQVLRVLERNRSQTVALHGAGFQPAMRIEYLRSGEQVEPELTIDEVCVLSGSQAEVDLSVWALASLTERRPIAYELACTAPEPSELARDPASTSLPLVADNLNSIVGPQGAARISPSGATRPKGRSAAVSSAST